MDATLRVVGARIGSAGWIIAAALLYNNGHHNGGVIVGFLAFWLAW